MGWNKVIKPTKGTMRNTLWVYGDMSNTLTFYDYTGDYSQVPTTSNADPLEFQGIRIYMPDFLEDILDGETSKNNVFIAGFNVNPQGGESGAYVCFMMDIITYYHVDTECWARLRLRVVKRLYDYAGTHYTESYPVGDTAQPGEFIFRSAISNDHGTDMIFFFKTATYNGVPNYVLGWAHCLHTGLAYCSWTGMAYRIKKTYFESSTAWGANAEVPESVDESEEFGKAAQPKGGYNEDATHGSFDDTSDQITVSSKPSLSVGDSGFVHAYYVTESILQSIGSALFPSIESQSFTGIPEAIDYLTMVMFYNKRTDYILDVLILPFDVPHSSSASRVRVGGSELVVQEGGEQVYCQAYPVTDYYVDVDCGSLSIPEYWANFLDFSGTRFKIFLPAVGYVDLQNEFINGGTVNVKYRFNIVDGSFMCFITATSGHSELEQSLVAQYSGVWCMHIPITGQDYTNKISGLISSVGTVAAGGLLGGGGAFMGAVNSLANTAMQKPQMTHANGYNASSSFLTHRKPYLIIERQSSQFSEMYPSETGLPCYVTRKLSTLRGFTVIENPVLNIACSDVEYNELVQLLKSGIIL